MICPACCVFSGSGAGAASGLGWRWISAGATPAETGLRAFLIAAADCAASASSGPNASPTATDCIVGRGFPFC